MCLWPGNHQHSFCIRKLKWNISAERPWSQNTTRLNLGSLLHTWLVNDSWTQRLFPQWRSRHWKESKRICLRFRKVVSLIYNHYNLKLKIKGLISDSLDDWWHVQIDHDSHMKWIAYMPLNIIKMFFVFDIFISDSVTNLVFNIWKSFDVFVCFSCFSKRRISTE